MPDIEISKIKARRGTDAQRKLISLDQGEFAYTIDTKRLFVGNGVTVGGDVVGNKIHPPLINYTTLSTVNAQVGDVCPVNNVYYQLIYPDYTNFSNWQIIRLDVDPVPFSYTANSVLSLNIDSISAAYIDSSTVSNGVKISSGVLQVDFQPKSLELSSLKISLKASGIDEREISSSAFSKGLIGGSGTKFTINADPNNFYFNGSDKLALSGYTPFILRFTNLPSTWFGDGLIYNPTLSTISTVLTNVSVDNTILKDGITGEISLNTAIFGDGLSYDTVSNSVSANVADVDGVSVLRNSLGVIKINDNVVASTYPLSKTTIDQFGRTTSQQSSIVSALTGNSTLNSNNSLSAIFNGSIVAAVPGLNITTFTAVSAGGTTLTLSSAGFITFEGPSTTQQGQTIQRFAIPIFSY